MSEEAEPSSALLGIASTGMCSPEPYVSRKNGANGRWRKLRTTIQVARRLRSPQVEVVKDLDELIADVSRTPTPHRQPSPSSFKAALGAYRQLERLFTLITRGSPDDLLALSQILDSDPRRYLCTETDASSLVNRRSLAGHTLMYEAAVMGNVQAVEVLIKHGADAHLQSKVSPTEEESPLEGASRWGHCSVVDFLLTALPWSKREVKKAAKCATSEILQRRLAKEMKKWRKKSCCWR